MNHGVLNKIRLEFWDEFVGVLKGLKKDDSTLKICFEGCYISFNSETEEAKVAEKILNGSLIDRKIAVLRTDLPQQPLLVRLIAEREEIGKTFGLKLTHRTSS